MRDRFDRILEGLLPDNGGAVLLAVSGGIDSMVMADLFRKSSFGKRIALAHCNFHLRGNESDGDAFFVRDWAESVGIPFFTTDFDTLGYAKSNGVSVEIAARELRYGWFASICESEGFQALAVAHNANDNAETLVLNLLQGTGLKGICGIQESSPLPGSSALLIRPMLGFSRDEIREYAVNHAVKWREDSSNADSAYKRNLIRNEVFPLFERLNPSFLETLASDIRHFGQIQSVVDDFVARASESVSGESPGKDLVIDVAKLRRQPHWDYLLFRLLEPYGFNESVIRDLVTLIKGDLTFSGRRFCSSTHQAITSRNEISVVGIGSEESVAQNDSVEVKGPGEYEVAGVSLKVEVAEIEDPRQPEGISAINMSFPFTVRLWKPGDWMRPLGMNGRRKKLSDMFVDLKLSAGQKERALVIADEGSHV
ncbi:MAG: tRNA lysidine(34) synthetase TilS, partial [Bacteroidales bacterium]|nr:tRNA lysidine(34) synthetase TilS [Bacteroidales bacterium]